MPICLFGLQVNARTQPHFLITSSTKKSRWFSHISAALIYCTTADFDPCFSCACNFEASDFVGEFFFLSNLSPVMGR